MQKLAGIVLIIGSLLFVVAAFAPITNRVVMASDAQKRVEYIQNDQIGWLLVNILFGAGSVIAIVGLGLFVRHVQGIGDNQSVKLVSYLSLAAAAFGALLWVIISYNRVALAPQELASNLGVNTWLFPAYTLFTQFALMIVGFLLIQSGYPRWQGWGMLGLAGLSLVAFLLFKDMPPFAHYVPLLVMGIALVR